MFKYGGQSANTAFNNEDDVGASILTPPNISPLVKAANWYKQLNRLHVIVGLSAVLFVGLIIGLSIYFGGSSKVEHRKHHHHHPIHIKPEPPTEPYSPNKLPRRIKEMPAMGIIDSMFKMKDGHQYYYYECKECPGDKVLERSAEWGCRLTLYKPDTTKIETDLFYDKKKTPAKKLAAENAITTVYSSIAFKFNNKTNNEPTPQNPPSHGDCKELKVDT